MSDEKDLGADAAAVETARSAEAASSASHDEIVARIKQGARDYLAYLSSDKPLGTQEFQTLKGRIVTLACILLRANDSNAKLALETLDVGNADQLLSEASRSVPSAAQKGI